MESLQPYLDFALRAAWQAGEITLKYFQTGLQVEAKSDTSPVTIADRQAEQFIRGQIEAAYPGHGLIGEEYGETNPSSPYRWVIDPLDGTRAFVRGVPLYGVLIGLLLDGAPQVGVAHFPALRETVWAASGLGCFHNHRPAHVSATRDLSHALLSTTNFRSFALAGKEARWQRLQTCLHHVAGWSDAYGYLLVATGRADIMIDPLMAVWDCGPFPVILQEAGGYFGDWRGNVTLTANEGLATNLNLLPYVLELLDPGA